MNVGMFRDLLGALLDAKVEFVLIGGLAGTVHGATRATYDVDVVYRRTPESIQRLVNALANHAPYLRVALPGLPFRLDIDTIRCGLNFTLTTDLGPIDLLGEVAGGGTYEELLPYTESVEFIESSIRCVTLPMLIQLKRAAGRPKDLEVIAELEALLEARNKLR